MAVLVVDLPKVVHIAEKKREERTALPRVIHSLRQGAVELAPVQL